MAQPTHEDAVLVVQLAQWSSTAGLVEAVDWIFSDDFVSEHAQFVINFPPTSERYRQVHTTLNYFETVGTLHKHGLINEQLLFDWLAVAEGAVAASHGEVIEAIAGGDKGAVSRAREAAEQQATQVLDLREQVEAGRLRIQRKQQVADDFAHDHADALLAECQVEVERVTAQLNETVGVVLEHHRALVEQTRELDRIISAGGGEPRLDGPPPTHAWQVALHELGRTVQQHPVLEAPRPRWRGREAAAQRDAVAQAIQDQRKAA